MTTKFKELYESNKDREGKCLNDGGVETINTIVLDVSESEIVWVMISGNSMRIYKLLCDNEYKQSIYMHRNCIKTLCDNQNLIKYM